MAAAVLVTGAPGVGKSRVAEELEGWLVGRYPTHRVAQLRGDPVRARTPLALLEALVRLDGDDPERVWLDWVEGELARGPLLLVVDDLQLADRGSIELLGAALRELRDQPLLVLALAQSEVFERHPRLWHEYGVTHIALGELARRAAERVAREVLGQVPADLIERVVDRAGGNAFFLEELLRSVLEGGDAALPETVLGVVQARLARLSVDARRALRAGSVFGATFWTGGVAALLGNATPDDLAGWLGLAQEHEVIVSHATSRFAGEVEYAFRHDYLREAAYATLTVEDRRRGQRLAARWLAERGDPEAAAGHEALVRSDL